jgi:hypothetical protein
MRWRKPKESSEILRPQTDASDPKQNKETPRTHRNGFIFLVVFIEACLPKLSKHGKQKTKEQEKAT